MKQLDKVNNAYVSIYRLDGVDDGTRDLYKTGVLQLSRLSHYWRDEISSQKEEIFKQVSFDDTFVITLHPSRYPCKSYVVESKKQYDELPCLLIASGIEYCYIFSKNKQLNENADIQRLKETCRELCISLEINITD